MCVNANAARCRPSLGIDILVTEGGIGPSPAGTYHQRLKVVLASKADRDRAVVLVVIIHLVTGHWAARDEIHEGLRRQRTGIPVAVIARLPLLGSVDAEQADALTKNFTVSPSDTEKPCEVPVPLVSESVWANAGTAAVQSKISAKQIFTKARFPSVGHLWPRPSPNDRPSTPHRQDRNCTAYRDKEKPRLLTGAELGRGRLYLIMRRARGCQRETRRLGRRRSA
jgi:hypothetical protein